MKGMGNAGIGRCNVCAEQTLHLRNVLLNNDQVLVISRCATCDTHPCPNCGGRTLDPTADKCKHCQQHLSLPRI